MNKLRTAGLISAFVFIPVLIWMWWIYTPYQSHYISGLRILGDSTTQTLIGTAKDGRGDEWATYIPILKQAYLEGFPARSALAPYYEQLNWFIKLPRADASLIFLPNQIVYWLLPGGKALAFQALYYYSLLLLSILWLSRNIGIRLVVAVPMALAVIFSQFFQVWWTSNFPTLGASILPLAIFTSRLARPYKLTLLYWSLAHMLFGEIYPPFYVSLAYALVPFILAVRPDLFKPKELLGAALIAALALATFYVFNSGFIHAVSATSYPGHRNSVGGTSAIDAFLGLIFPGFPVQDAQNSVYELSVVGTISPLLLLACLPYIEWDRKAKLVSIVSLITFLALFIYAIWGVPLWLAKVTGLSLVPGTRIQYGLSLLAVLYSCFMLSKNLERLRVWPLVVVFVIYLGVSLALPPLTIIRESFKGIRYFSVVPLIFLGVSFVYYRRRLNGRYAALIVLYGTAAAHIFVFGSFNPWMRGDDILRPVDSQVISDYRDLLALSNGRPISIIGNYGHLLRGEGLPAYEAVHLANVDKDIYKKAFPSLTEAQREAQFNRFTGIAFDNVSHMQPAGATTIFPVQPHAVAFAHTYVQSREQVKSILKQPPDVTLDKEEGLYVARWKAILATPLPIDAKLVVTSPCAVQASWLTRYPVRMDGAPRVAVALQGLAGALTLQAKTRDEAAACIAQLQVSEENPAP